MFEDENLNVGCVWFIINYCKCSVVSLPVPHLPKPYWELPSGEYAGTIRRGASKLTQTLQLFKKEKV